MYVLLVGHRDGYYNVSIKTADFPSPERVICTRKTPSIQGMGLHKCPGISFVDEVNISLIVTSNRISLCFIDNAGGNLLLVLV
jgi:hypothetical protein